MTKRQFIEFITPQLDSSGFSLYLHKEPCGRNKYVAGTFDHIQKKITIYPRAKTSTYIHEFCHFLQYKEKRLFFEKCLASMTLLGHKVPLSSRESLLAIQDWVRLEWDCMNRELSLYHKLNLRYNLERMFQSNNNYLWSLYFGEPNNSSLKAFSKQFFKLSHYLDIRNLDKDTKVKAGWDGVKKFGLYGDA